MVAAAFNLIDRVADALAFEPLSHTLSREQVLELEGRALLEHGYA